MVRGTEGPLARLFEQGSVAGMTDGQLLDRFTSRRGDAAEAAFEALVARHGPMVARVCRSCLRDEHDVEDAFQATFLVLVRRAGAIGERDLLAPWLYGVAHRVARKARAVAAKRRGREGGPADIDPPARADASITLGVDLGPVLHEEVDRLPAKYRQPVILCHLQGLTHAQAAQELAWPVGTVSVRLARARKILADRLARRGVTASVTVVAGALATEATAATLAPSWIHVAAVAALTAASGLPLTTAALSAGAITLARRTSMTMLLSSWKWLALPAAVALTTATGAALVGSAGPGDQPQGAPAAASAKIAAPAATEKPAVKSAGAAIVAAGNVTEQHQENPQRSVVYADNMVINGTVAGLQKTVKQLAESNPNATFELRLSGGNLRFTGDGSGTVAIADPASLGQTSSPARTQRKSVPPPEAEMPPLPTPMVVAPYVEDVNIHGFKYPAPADILKAAGHTPVPPGRVPLKLSNPPLPTPGVSAVSAPVQDGPMTDDEPSLVVVPPVIAFPNGSFDLGSTPPPGYFDLPAPKPGERGAPQPVRIGQTLLVEALEGLPGRPITGERVVRTDGTISLGFYGDLYVAGLNRDQIKVKLLEKLRTYLSDSVLGLYGFKDGKVVAIAPVESNRVYIDDQPNLPARLPATQEPATKSVATTTPPSVSRPVPVKIGQTLVIEVLEALPGRPISGERVVRPDGTVGLGFYGDVAVAGLTREQVKVKVIEHLRKYLNDDVLGLRIVNSRTQQVEAVAPARSDRIFVDDLVDYDPSRVTEPAPDGKVQVGQILVIEVLETLAGRPITGTRIVHPDGTINLGFYGDLPVVGLTREQIKVKVIEFLRAKLSDEQLGLAKDLGGEKKIIAPVDSDCVFVDDAVPRPEPRAADQVKQLSEQVTDLSGKLDAALGAIEQLRRDRPRAAVGPPRR